MGIRRKTGKKAESVVADWASEMLRVHLEEEKASGRTPEQAKAKRQMDGILYFAATGQELIIPPPPMITLAPWRGPERGTLWVMYQNAELGCEWLKSRIEDPDEGLAELFALMYFGLATFMENTALANEAKFAAPHEKGPQANELCTCCRHRIESRYLPSLDPAESTEKARALRLFFPVKGRRDRRTDRVRDAWRIARRSKLFPSKNKFAEYATERVHLSVRWILKSIQAEPGPKV